MAIDEKIKSINNYLKEIHKHNPDEDVEELINNINQLIVDFL